MRERRPDHYRKNTWVCACGGEYSTLRDIEWHISSWAQDLVPGLSSEDHYIKFRGRKKGAPGIQSDD